MEIILKDRQMSSSEKVSLEKLAQALTQPNIAIRKRALAIIYNEARAEAYSLVEEYVGKESKPDLQNLGLKVLAKLKEFKNRSSEVPLDRLLDFLRHPNPDNRLLALRALANQKSPRIAELVVANCLDNPTGETLELVAGILKDNPNPKSIPFLIELLDHPEEKLRIVALEGILSVIFGYMLPYVLKSLLDPSTQLKMKAYQLIGNISRANLLEALGNMLANPSKDMSQLAGKLLPSFLAPDLLPLLEGNVMHADAETAALCRRAVSLLAQKGHFEAVRLLDKLKQKDQPRQTVTQAQIDETAFISRFPRFMVEPMAQLPAEESPQKIIHITKEVFSRISDFLTASMICAYFKFAARDAWCDKHCFKVLQTGVEKSDLIRFLSTISPAFQKSRIPGGLFPNNLAYSIQKDFNNRIIEILTTFREKAKNPTENELQTNALASSLKCDLNAILESVSEISKNRLAVKLSDAGGVKVFDFMSFNPEIIDEKLLMNFQIPMHTPVLISENFGSSLSLAPFYQFSPEKRMIIRIDPAEDELWDFLNRHKILEPFLAFLKDKIA